MLISRTAPNAAAATPSKTDLSVMMPLISSQCFLPKIGNLIDLGPTMMQNEEGTMQQVKEIAYHRNGICGLGFYVAVVKEKEDGKERDMLVIRFPDADDQMGSVVCAAFDLALLAEKNITFGVNSWRGDHYYVAMDAAIKDYRAAMNAKFAS